MLKQPQPDRRFVPPGMVQLAITHRPGCGCRLDTPDPDDTTIQLGCVTGYHVQLPGPNRCRCDPNDLFDPPNSTPRAVANCPRHRFRRTVQQLIERHRDDPDLNAPEPEERS